MFKKIVTGTLVLVVLSTSGTVIYANPDDSNDIIDANKKEFKEVQEDIIKLISPKISPLKEVIQEKDDLLISIQILTDSSVTMSVYKELQEAEELIFEEENIKKENLLFGTYYKKLNGIQPGNYKITFKKDNETEYFKIISFKVKKELPDLINKSFTDLLLGK